MEVLEYASDLQIQFTCICNQIAFTPFLMPHQHESCDIETLLDNVGLKKTKDRHNIVLLFQEPRTWTLNTLYHDAHHTHFSTVFRNIKLLLQKGLIRSVGTGNGETHYEWARQKHHDHKLCEKCDTVECVPCPVPKLKKHQLELAGLCKTCK